MLDHTHRLEFLAFMLVLAGGFTAPVTMVDRVVDEGYSRHIVERLPEDDVAAILEGSSDQRSGWTPSPSVTP